MKQNAVLAYLLTYHTYGTWLHGDQEGSVDRVNNIPGTPLLPPDPRREAFERAEMKQPPYYLDAPRRQCVLATIQEVCVHRRWSLLAAHIRSTHAHVVVHAPTDPEKVMNDFKAYSSRRLTEAGFEDRNRKRWSRHGSTRYLWEIDSVEGAIRYTIDEQGELMAWYENLERTIYYPPPD
jgi:REP element-mobilizing transposase RayT